MLNKEMTGKDNVRFKRVLVPLDGSELGEAALPYVEQMAVAMNAEVILFHVVTSHYDIALAESYSTQLGHLREEYEERASVSAGEYLERIAGRLREKGIKVRSEVEVGTPAERVIGYAKDNEVDLIAVSAHGHSGFSRWLLGSVADKIAHVADMPVLLVRASGQASE